MTHAPLTDAKVALDFIHGGNARFTIRSRKTQTRYTYKVTEPKGPGLYFVSLMTGRDNEADFSYLGMIRGGVFSLTRGSTMLASRDPVKAFEWTYRQLTVKGVIPDTLEVWHEGRCGRCGRLLTVPESIASGFGPECSKVRQALQPSLF